MMHKNKQKQGIRKRRYSKTAKQRFIEKRKLRNLFCVYLLDYCSTADVTHTLGNGVFTAFFLVEILFKFSDEFFCNHSCLHGKPHPFKDILYHAQRSTQKDICNLLIKKKKNRRKLKRQPIRIAFRLSKNYIIIQPGELSEGNTPLT